MDSNISFPCHVHDAIFTPRGTKNLFFSRLKSVLKLRMFFLALKANVSELKKISFDEKYLVQRRNNDLT